MKLIPLYVMLIMLFANSALAAETKLNTYNSAAELPHWFKDSFLDLADDIQEAREEGKQLLLYFHQPGCPYCANLVQQSFLDPAMSQFIQEHFDLVALHLWGDREVTLPDGTVLTEKELAVQWEIQYTPTLLFFSDTETPPLRIAGYRSREMLARIMDYAISGDTATSLAKTMIQPDPTAALSASEQLLPGNEMHKNKEHKPVVLLFEYPGCDDCTQLHKQVLNRSDTQQLIQQFTTYRFDVTSTELITFPDGSRKTAATFADELRLTYYPSVVLLDAKGTERLRIDAYVQAFHFHTALEFVSKKIYLHMPEFQRYINARADRLRRDGNEVLITE